MPRCLCVPDYTTDETLGLLTSSLTSSAQENCRKSRNVTFKWRSKVVLTTILRFLFWTAGYNKRLTRKSVAYSCLLFIFCWYQVVYSVYKLLGCPEFICHEFRNLTSTRQLEYTAYLTSDLGSAASFTFMLVCLNILYRPASNAISPYGGLRDMANVKSKIMLIVVLASSTVYIFYTTLFVCIKSLRTEKEYKPGRFYGSLFSEVCELIAQWVSLVSLYAFSSSCFAIGAFASDTLRRIKTQRGGNIDDIIKIHKELRCIVTDTTNSYAGWFLLRWFLHGISVIVGFVVVALHKFGHDDKTQQVYFGTFFVNSLFVFVFPCVCAAYVTSTCGSISAKINNTTSGDWDETHIFRERRDLQLFVAYCSASPICFKIGRITFTSTLAWFSFFFGGTGLLFHFF